MEIKNLKNTSLEIIVDCMNQAFQNYFVKIPSDVDFWAKRYHAARADFSLSFGVFDREKLVAFIIQGIDFHNNKKTAFNTGTGVLEAYRGQRLVDQIYDYAMPIMKENGIDKCMLEVIDQNHRAVRVYERIGFQKDRFLRCLKGDLIDFDQTSNFRQVDITTIIDSISRFQKYYSWDNSLDAILKGGEQFATYKVIDKSSNDIGYFVLNTLNSALIQVESYEGKYWDQVLSALKKINPSIRINNVDDARKDVINVFTKAGLQNHINQFEMSFFI